MPVFKSVGCEEEWVGGVPTEREMLAFSHVHEVLTVLLQVVPMSRDVLVQVVVNNFPYIRRPSHEHESYVYNILEIVKRQPGLRLEFLLLIMKKLVALDVYAPRAEVLDAEDKGAELFEMETHLGMCHPEANTLDVVMVQLLGFVQAQCGPQDWERIRALYHDLLAAFDQVVLTTHATHHVQFLLFYLCSFRAVMAEAFVGFLWRKVTSPNVAPVIRQSAVMYLGSLLARAAYVNVSMLKTSLAEMSVWIHSYICNQDGLESAKLDVRIHAVFYTICQALFYVIAFRHSDLIDSKKNLMFLQSLNLTKMVTCKLNPLRVCSPVVTQNFAAVTRMYQLAYCYSIMEHNARNSMPVVHEHHRGLAACKSAWVDTFFPFDPFILQRSAHYIQPIYRSYQKPADDGSCNVQKEEDDRNEEEDEDDFLADETPRNSCSNSPSFRDIFSYSSSPGFKWM
ncbi:RNA polymerase I-specific transcription initiation factor RRN3 isoform X2 [Periplaneta americana]